MAVLRINRGLKVVVDAKDLPILRKWKWSAEFRNGRTYIVRGGSLGSRGKHKQVYLHRFIMACPPGKEVLCKDGNRLNCRRRNLVICDQSVKHFKRKPPPNKTGFKGVYLNKNGRYVAECTAYGVRYYGGKYSNPVSAAKAYDALAREHHGRFARLNFPRAREVGC